MGGEAGSAASPDFLILSDGSGECQGAFRKIMPRPLVVAAVSAGEDVAVGAAARREWGLRRWLRPGGLYSLKEMRRVAFNRGAQQGRPHSGSRPRNGCVPSPTALP